jgi:hypothetical protein
MRTAGSFRGGRRARSGEGGGQAIEDNDERSGGAAEDQQRRREELVADGERHSEARTRSIGGA